MLLRLGQRLDRTHRSRRCQQRRDVSAGAGKIPLPPVTNLTAERTTNRILQQQITEVHDLRIANGTHNAAHAARHSNPLSGTGAEVVHSAVAR